MASNYNAQNGNRDWETAVKNNARTVKFTHTLDQPGYHTLRVWMVDLAVVLEKLVVNLGGLKPSYLGPPESWRGDRPAPTGSLQHGAAHVRFAGARSSAYGIRPFPTSEGWGKALKTMRQVHFPWRDV